MFGEGLVGEQAEDGYTGLSSDVDLAIEEQRQKVGGTGWSADIQREPVLELAFVLLQLSKNDCWQG